ncbi:DUF1697 domain-containing protein [Miniimonas arenae]|uniref:DUF1697 domain-containing protein n=1 Tax=Miniimonas arenae TaxID=676201 RepID=A0A5C5BDI8_9MICO|nr:DUF1697 domain-containing protein [Miniimonas arenae]TNU74714.1 DUF1697 domain-containing protein [Miniimonas arenae]
MTSTRWALLLRGVNVGGVTIRSADLKACLADAGFDDVRTVLASGNALVTTTGGASASAASTVRTRAEAAVGERFGRDVPLLVRTQEEVRDAVERCPYLADATTHHAYLVLTEDEPAARALHEAMAAVVGDDPAQEAVELGARLVYWWCPKGSSLVTPVSKVTAKTRLVTTTRNVRTMRKLCED